VFRCGTYRSTVARSDLAHSHVGSRRELVIKMENKKRKLLDMAK
jgi:hypothetical protein